MGRIGWLAAALAICVGCGGDGGSGGSGGGSGGGGGGPSLPRGEGFELSTGLGFTAIPEPLAGEANIHGSLFLTRDEAPIQEAEVSINGIPLRTLFGIATPHEGEIFPDVAPGSTLRIEASAGADSVVLDAPCPSGVEILSPAEGEVFAAGAPIEVRWSGDVFAGPSPFNPLLTLRADGGDSRLEQLGSVAPLSPGDTRATLAASGAAVGRAAYVVLTVPGPFVEEANGAGGAHEASCSLQLRRRIEVVAP